MPGKREEWDWLTFLLSWHEKEYERRYTLEGVVATPIGLLTGAFAIMYLFATQFDYHHGNYWMLAGFGVPLLAALVLALWSSTHIYRSYAVVKNRVYLGVPDANALRAHMSKLVEYYKQHAPKRDATREFKEYFVGILSDQLTTNVINNDERTRDIQRSKPHLRNSLLAILVAFPCFLWNQVTKPEPIQQVTLVAKQPTSPPQKVVPPTLPPPRERQIQESPKLRIR